MKKIKRPLILYIIMNILISNYAFATVGGLAVGNGVDSEIVTMGNKFLGIAQIIGTGVATIMLVVLAIKYMVSSVSDKAEIKKHAAVYIVGAICIYAGVGIIQIIKTFMEGI